MYEYDAIVIRVIDADTVVLDIDLGMATWRRSEHCRLARLDAPEVSTVEGKAARDAVKTLLTPLDKVRIQMTKFDKYGRSLVELELANGSNLNDYLLVSGLAKPYSGGAR